ncbi:hypothetical protein AX768_13455 [Burkholderia sp. PAMC 28687]|uniref:hypothetical protein n=1 Tax=Burkholderia sp. PAMC 28687 TaxID=1795874 RepID=UPI000782AA6A|nr:hypothetical protein [Burkholderia sp. PAMC 28687]AMM14953.1 hypothetical protein AX768_13455 [Burkholderia sp. PAMC 28687]
MAEAHKDTLSPEVRKELKDHATLCGYAMRDAVEVLHAVKALRSDTLALQLPGFDVWGAILKLEQDVYTLLSAAANSQEITTRQLKE